MRFPGRTAARTSDYAVHPSYAKARGAFLALTRPDQSPVHSGTRVWGVAVDVALDTGVVTVYGLVDGTTSIHSSNGVHTTGLGRVPAVAAATADLLAAAERALPLLVEAAPADELALPARGFAVVRARTAEGDLMGGTRLAEHGGRGPLAAVAAAAETVMREAHDAVITGFVEADTTEDAGYEIAPAYRTMRRTMLSIAPAASPTAEAPRVAAALVEFGLGRVVVSLFALADGTASVHWSDGREAEGRVSGGAIESSGRDLLAVVEQSLGAFERSGGFPLPAHGHVQVIARLFPGADPRAPFVRASVPYADVAAGHPLAAAVAEARAMVALPDPDGPAATGPATPSERHPSG